MSPSAARVEALLTELGIQDRVTRVAENVWTLQKGSATVQIVAAPEFVVATAKVAEAAPAAETLAVATTNSGAATICTVAEPFCNVHTF